MDTTVFIYLARGQERAQRFLPYVEGRRVVLSFVSVAELWRGAYAQQYGVARRRRLESDIAGTVVVQPTEDLAHEWARLSNEARGMSPGHALGQKAQAHDAWIAATARLYKLPLLTEDSDFAGMPGLSLLLDDPVR
ncbi:putative nucleic acid-binding protein [Conexibacter arvalis]|uniref:Putative nucleic acid-binding protein n=1 Tax=Conexibacter arvalis TaxID=912552 RepID=A0A840ICA1_9ACTN|nr:putative nucleic acid-binding protein [Conexibacter arvalis]